ncbi:ABC transporter permease [Candidatus Uabimicrobium amorphum]|uniref:Peptide ABC transporter permease n=1 Tax=Uabimicrobium amorphum TaxID=2596890 RepID=A0A5S9F4G9_UABAM|nr:ABC transporter permease subunit [Candidatus Uabimicrobium amorphum]BBM85291.1 peptide ABC transporter permease [Candidatus Uabimicrobium amorphum]
MFVYFCKRILGMIPVLLVIITVTFFLMRFAPGGPFSSEKKLSAEIKKNLEKKYHMDKPLVVQYFYYLGMILQGDLGPSMKYENKTVVGIIKEKFAVSLRIGFMAMFIALLLGTTIGFFAALNQNSFIDYTCMSFAILGISVPNLVLGPILAVTFGLWLGWLPVAGWGELKHYILPVITLSCYYIAIIARIARGSMLEVIRQDYIKTARSKGLSDWTIITRHAMKGALLPIVSYVGPASAFIITGSIVVEQIFGIPGVGREFVMGAIDRDYTMVMGTVILVSILVMTFNLFVDIAYGFIDPRIKLHEEK